MKIAIFTDTYLPDINGVVTSIKLEVEQLEKMGHEVVIVTSSNKKLAPKWEGNILRLQGFKLTKKMYNYKISWVYSWRASRQLKKQKIDVVHIHSEFGVASFGRLWAKFNKIPTVYTYHTMYEDYKHYIGGKRDGGVVHKLTIQTSRVLSDGCDELIAPTNKTRNKLREYGVDQYINVIPTGIDLEKFKLKRYTKEEVDSLRKQFLANDEICFMFVGRIAKEKNLELLLDAVKNIKTESLKFKVLIVGDGPNIKSLKDRVNKLQLSSIVKFLGKVPNDKVGLYYQICDYFVSPSTSETQGLTYVEAMASGKPVLAMRDLASEDIVIDGVNGWLFDGLEKLSDQLCKAIRLDADNYKKMRVRSVITSEKYDPDLFGTKIEEVLTRAISLY